MNRMTARHIVTFAVSILIVSLLRAWAVAVPFPHVNEIQMPLFSAPAIIPDGTSFALTVKLPEGAKLEAAYLQRVGKPEAQIEAGVAPAASAAGLSNFTATVPAGTPEGLYDLAVRFSGNLWDHQPRAVKVIAAYKTDYDFVHLTDIHFNTQHIDGKDMSRIRRKLLQDIAQLNPEFVLFTGDLGLSPEDYDRDYPFGYEEFMEWMPVAMHMVPGNHELYVRGATDGVDYWHAFYGPLWHAFDYGNTRFIGLDTFDWPADLRDRENPVVKDTDLDSYGMLSDAQWNWLQGQLGEVRAGGKSCVVFTHIPLRLMKGGAKIGDAAKPYVVPGPDEKTMTSRLAEGGCTYAFVGHLHYDLTNRYGRLTEVLTPAAGISKGGLKRKWSFRVVHVRSGKITGTELHEVGFEDLK